MRQLVELMIKGIETVLRSKDPDVYDESALENNVVQFCAHLVYKDVVQVGALTQEAIAGLLEGGKFFKLNRKDMVEGLAVYEAFVATTSRVEKFHQVCTKYECNVGNQYVEMSKTLLALLPALRNHVKDWSPEKRDAALEAEAGASAMLEHVVIPEDIDPMNDTMEIMPESPAQRAADGVDEELSPEAKQKRRSSFVPDFSDEPIARGDSANSFADTPTTPELGRNTRAETPLYENLPDVVAESPYENLDPLTDAEVAAESAYENVDPLTDAEAAALEAATAVPVVRSVPAPPAETPVPDRAPPPTPEGSSSGGGGPAWIPSEHIPVYEALWDLAVPSGNEFLGPGPAVAFLTKSGLDKPFLGQIWTMADSKKGGKLNKPEFFVALKLIALKQAGQPTTLAAIGTSTPLPTLGEHTDKVLAAVGGGGSDTAGEGGGRKKSDYIDVAPDAGGTVPSAEYPFVTVDQLPVYEQLWQLAVPAGSTSLGPAPAVAFLTKSGLDKALLGAIWKLTGAKGVLGKKEFFVALKLIAVKQMGGEAELVNLEMAASLPQLDDFTEKARSLAPPPKKTAPPPPAETKKKGKPPPPPVSRRNRASKPSKEYEFLLEDQLAVYSELWKQAVPPGADFMAPGPAVGFLTSSGCDKKVLGTFWTLSGAKGQLNKSQFFAVLKLIALVQSGKDPTLANLDVDAPLPALDGHTEEALEQAAAGEEIEEGEQMTLIVMAQLLWDRIGDKVNASGTVGGKDCAPVLSMAVGVKELQLGKIWGLVDFASKGRVTFKQFGKLLGAIGQVQQGQDVDVASIGLDSLAPTMRGVND
jgi:hypothetical protein